MSPDPNRAVLDRVRPESATKAPPTTLSRPVVWLLAAATGAIAANLYYAQPLLHVIAATFGVSSGAAGLLVTLTQIGFAAGLLLVLPLADVVNARKLFSILLVIDAAALAVVASAPNLTVAVIGFAVVGLANVAAQVIVPLAASMASDEERGRVVGTVITGLLVGILVARTVSGLVSQVVGWRPLFLAAAVLMIVVAVVVRSVLPASSASMRYSHVLRSLAVLYRTHHHLRVRSAYGSLAFAAFSLFWSTVAFLLAGPHYHFSVAVIGLFGLLGVAGATTANLVGRFRRPRHPLPTLAAVGIIGASFIVLWAGQGSLLCVIVGILVLDIGAQGLHVLNQRTIYELDAAARSRINSVYMIFYFLGGALGSAAGSLAFGIGGWTGVCIVGLVIAALGGLLWTATVVGGMARSRRSVPSS